MAKSYYWNEVVYGNTAGSRISEYPWFFRMYAATTGGTVYSSDKSTTTANVVFTNTFVLNDAFYIGSTAGGGGPAGRKFRDLYFSNNTVMAATTSYTLVWEYYTTGGAWATLTCTDGTNSFTTTGTDLKVAFVPPTDWGHLSVNSWPAWWIRARVSAITGTATSGATMATSTYIKAGSNTLAIASGSGSDIFTWDDIYDYDQASGAAEATALITGGARAYSFPFHISLARTNIIGVTNTNAYFNDFGFDVSFSDYSLLSCNLATSEITFGKESVTNDRGFFGGTINFNIPTGAVRVDDKIIGLCKWYNVNFNMYQNSLPLSGSTLGHGYTISDISTASIFHEVAPAGFNIFHVFSSSGSIKHFVIKYVTFPMTIVTTGTMEDIILNTGAGMLLNNTTYDPILSAVTISNNSTRTFTTIGHTGIVRIRNSNISAITNVSPNVINWTGTSTGSFRMQFSFDLTVTDKNGTAISGATVALTPTGSSANENFFSVSSAADGTITKQWVTALRYTYGGSANVSTIETFSPFTLTVSKSGYQTVVVKGITLDKTRTLNGFWGAVALPDPAAGGGNLNLSPEVIQV